MLTHVHCSLGPQGGEGENSGGVLDEETKASATSLGPASPPVQPFASGS